MTSRSLTVLAVAAALAVAAPGRASAQQGSELLTGWLVLDPGGVDGIGIGGRYLLPLAPGVVHHPRIRDEFTLEFGADFLHYGDTVGVPPYEVEYSWNGLLFAVGGAWNFWLTPRFAVYPKLDLGFSFGSYSGWSDRYGYGRHDYGGLYVEPALGLIYAFGRAAFRLELGSDLIRLGLAFSL